MTSPEKQAETREFRFDPPPVLRRNGKRPCIFCGCEEDTLATPGRRYLRNPRPETDPAICFACAVWAVGAFLEDAEGAGAMARAVARANAAQPEPSPAAGEAKR